MWKNVAYAQCKMEKIHKLLKFYLIIDKKNLLFRE